MFFADIHIPIKVNGQTFKLRPDNEEALLEKANILFEVKRKLTILVDYMQDNAVPTKQDANRLWDRFKDTEIRETGWLETSTAYTLNKGWQIRLCLDKSNNTTYNTNAIMFVALHELAHVLSISYGHNDEFKDNMELIVKTATKLGLYNPVDYSINPIVYCGTKITNTPCSNGRCLF